MASTQSNASITSPGEHARSDSEHLLLALDLPALRGKRVLIVRGDGGRDFPGRRLARGRRPVSTSLPPTGAPCQALTPALRATLEQLLQHNNDWVITSSEALRGLLSLLAEMDAERRETAFVVKMKQQHLIVPHARIAQSAAELGFAHVTLTGSGDAGVLAALQSRP